MKQARLGPIPLDLCMACSGVWFDDGELAQLVQGGPAAIRKLGERLFHARHMAVPAKAGKCPVCWVPLQDVTFPSLPNVRLDGCRLCLGLWVPLAALSRILVRVEEQLASHPTATRDIPAPGPLYPAPGIIPREEPAPSRPRPVPAAATAGNARAAQAVRPAVQRPEGQKCPGCGERNTAGAAVCWACGGFMRPAGGGHCPGCGGLLHLESLNDIQFGFCDGCGGTWLEDRQLDQLRSQPVFQQEAMLDRIGSGSGSLPLLSGVTPSCPKCHVSLVPELLGMVSTEPIQTCPACYGSFLEGGRLAHLLVGRRK